MIIAVAFGALLATAEWLRARWQWPAEWTRKWVHLGGGGICLFIPFLIESHWAVLVLSLGLGGLFIGSRAAGWLQSVHAIKRKSRGSEYYPVVVYLLFLLSNDQPWLFSICILVLAVSDSAAALVGGHFGKLRFVIEDERKSVEGALAFLLSTFVVVLIPLLLWNPLESELWPDEPQIWHYVLASVLIGLLVTCFELISLHGKDNLFIPLGTFLVLTKTLQTDVADLICQNISFVGMLTAIVAIALVTKSFNIGGAIALCLACYGCWAMGSFDWAIPVFVGFGIYVCWCFVVGVPWKLKVRPIVLGVGVPMSILAIGNIALAYDYPEWTQFCFGPFLAAIIVALAQAFFNLVSWTYRRNSALWHWVIAVTTALSAFITTTYPLMIRNDFFEAGAIGLLVLATLPITWASAILLPCLPPGEAPTSWLYGRVGFSVAAAIAMTLFQWLQWAPLWPPL